jgi:hypothetical protein
MIRRVVLVALLPILSLELGCSGEENHARRTDGGVPACALPESTWDGSSPGVSLRSDLLSDVSADAGTGGGLMRRACAFGSCHDDTSAKAGLFLGPALRDREQNAVVLTDSQIDRFFAGADGVMRSSKTVPSMQIVKPGDPSNSFLMRKIDGCFSDLETGCSALQPTPVGACGETMPFGSELLSVEERDVFRRWIFQGAQNN